MNVVWFGNGLPGGEAPGKHRAIVEDYARENAEEIHELSHLAGESEIEIVKIIEGAQEIDGAGKVTLRTLELHFMKDLVLIERVIEVQGRGSYTTESSSTQLGYLEIPCSEDSCPCLNPKEK